MRRVALAAAMLFLVHTPAHAFSFGSPDLVGRAQAYLGKTARELGLPARLWCADFVNMLLHRKHASRSARSFAHYGSPANAGCVGCIAVFRRGRGGHVGVVSGWDGSNPIVISGNHGRAVGVGEYPRRRLIALRNP